MDFTALKTEITADAASLGYAGKTPAQQAALLQAANRVRQGSVPMTSVGIWAASTGVMAKLQARAANNIDPLQSASIALITIVQGGYPALDVTNAAVQQMMGAFEAAGDFTAAQAAQLMSLGQTLIPRWQEIGLPSMPQEGDVAYALSL